MLPKPLILYLKLLIVFLIGKPCLAQKKSSIEPFYIVNKSTFNTSYFKKDSIGYQIIKKDTLIVVNTLKHRKPTKHHTQKLAKNTIHKYHLIDFKTYKKNYKNKDSLGYIVKNNDTLISVSELKSSYKNVEYEYKDDSFLQIYKPIAFKSIPTNPDSTYTMKYWKSPISIFFAKSISKENKRKFMVFANEIVSNVDSLKIKQVKKLESSNYVIFSDKDYDYNLKTDKNLTSDYYINWNKRSQIYKGSLFINTEKIFTPSQQLIFLKQKFIESLGWFILSKNLDCKHMFSNCFSDEKMMRKLDWEILKYHYSYGICKGVPKHIFENIHIEAKSILNEHGGKVKYYIKHL